MNSVTEQQDDDAAVFRPDLIDQAVASLAARYFKGSTWRQADTTTLITPTATTTAAGGPDDKHPTHVPTPSLENIVVGIEAAEKDEQDAPPPPLPSLLKKKGLPTVGILDIVPQEIVGDALLEAIGYGLPPSPPPPAEAAVAVHSPSDDALGSEEGKVTNTRPKERSRERSTGRRAYTSELFEIPMGDEDVDEELYSEDDAETDYVSSVIRPLFVDKPSLRYNRPAAPPPPAHQLPLSLVQRKLQSLHGWAVQFLLPRLLWRVAERRSQFQEGLPNASPSSLPTASHSAAKKDNDAHAMMTRRQLNQQIAWLHLTTRASSIDNILCHSVASSPEVPVLLQALLCAAGASCRQRSEFDFRRRYAGRSFSLHQWSDLDSTDEDDDDGATRPLNDVLLVAAEVVLASTRKLGLYGRDGKFVGGLGLLHTRNEAESPQKVKGERDAGTCKDTTVVAIELFLELVNHLRKVMLRLLLYTEDATRAFGIAFGLSVELMLLLHQFELTQEPPAFAEAEQQQQRRSNNESPVEECEHDGARHTDEKGSENASTSMHSQTKNFFRLPQVSPPEALHQLSKRVLQVQQCYTMKADGKSMNDELFWMYDDVQDAFYEVTRYVRHVVSQYEAKVIQLMLDKCGAPVAHDNAYHRFLGTLRTMRKMWHGCLSVLERISWLRTASKHNDPTLIRQLVFYEYTERDVVAEQQRDLWQRFLNRVHDSIPRHGQTLLSFLAQLRQVEAQENEKRIELEGRQQEKFEFFDRLNIARGVRSLESDPKKVANLLVPTATTTLTLKAPGSPLVSQNISSPLKQPPPLPPTPSEPLAEDPTTSGAHAAITNHHAIIDHPATASPPLSTAVLPTAADTMKGDKSPTPPPPPTTASLPHPAAAAVLFPFSKPLPDLETDSATSSSLASVTPPRRPPTTNPYAASLPFRVHGLLHYQQEMSNRSLAGNTKAPTAPVLPPHVAELHRNEVGARGMIQQRERDEWHILFTFLSQQVQQLTQKCKQAVTDPRLGSASVRDPRRGGTRPGSAAIRASPLDLLDWSPPPSSPPSNGDAMKAMTSPPPQQPRPGGSAALRRPPSSGSGSARQRTLVLFVRQLLLEEEGWHSDDVTEALEHVEEWLTSRGTLVSQEAMNREYFLEPMYEECIAGPLRVEERQRQQDAALRVAQLTQACEETMARDALWEAACWERLEMHVLLEKMAEKERVRRAVALLRHDESIDRCGRIAVEEEQERSALQEFFALEHALLLLLPPRSDGAPEWGTSTTSAGTLRTTTARQGGGIVSPRGSCDADGGDTVRVSLLFHPSHETQHRFAIMELEQHELYRHLVIPHRSWHLTEVAERRSRLSIATEHVQLLFVELRMQFLRETLSLLVLQLHARDVSEQHPSKPLTLLPPPSSSSSSSAVALSHQRPQSGSTSLRAEALRAESARVQGLLAQQRLSMLQNRCATELAALENGETVMLLRLHGEESDAPNSPLPAVGLSPLRPQISGRWSAGPSSRRFLVRAKASAAAAAATSSSSETRTQSPLRERLASRPPTGRAMLADRVAVFEKLWD